MPVFVCACLWLSEEQPGLRVNIFLRCGYSRKSTETCVFMVCFSRHIPLSVVGSLVCFLFYMRNKEWMAGNNYYHFPKCQMPLPAQYSAQICARIVAILHAA